jgi:D-arabinose 1-dehydrogenase-like Zn-dependent alcohol dehydrogenase
MRTMRAVQVAHKGGPFQLVERPMPEPGSGEVRIKVEACGVCHSDSIAKDGLFPTVPYPIVPGHEVAGVIDAIGDGVVGWTPGTRVGVGWFGGSCGRCEPCRRGDMVSCLTKPIPGITCDGGYAEAMVSPVDALVRIPDDLASADAAPLLCAGVTTYNALRNSGARPGDLVGILGLGGLGHLGVQFAAKMGFRTVAIGRGGDKAGLARSLGAHLYVDSAAQNVAAELMTLGGAKVILATVPDSKVMSDVIPGLAVRGTLVVVGVGTEPLQVSALDLIPGNRSIKGHASGTAIDSEDALNFSVLSGVRPRIETMPLERAAEAYERMMSAQARFRMVLTTAA